MEHLELPGETTWEWVEAYGLLEADAAAVHGTWEEAREAVGEALERLAPRASLEKALAEAPQFGAAAARQPNARINDSTDAADSGADDSGADDYRH